MDGPLWSFLLDLAPIRRQVQREVSRACEEKEQQAHDALARTRERHLKELGEAKQRISELQRSISELRAHVADVETINRDLDATRRRLESRNRELQRELAARQEIERRRHEQEAKDADNTTSDLFRCQNPDCFSLWLLSRRPDHSYTTRKMAGAGCATCAGSEPLLRLAAVKAGVTEPDELARVARPLVEAPESEMDLSVPGDDRSARTDIGVRFIADLLQHGPDNAIADTLVHQASTFVRNEIDQIAPATRCAGLSAIADGLDQVPKVIRNGIAWCATEILGVPEFPAKVLGEVVTRVATLHVAPLHALHSVAQGVRAVGTVSCIADDHLGQCQCARHLVSNVAEPAIAEEFQRFLEHLGDMPADISRAPDTATEAPSLHDRPESSVADVSDPEELRQAPDHVTDMPPDVSEQPETVDEAPSHYDRLDSIDDDDDKWHDIGGI